MGRHLTRHIPVVLICWLAGASQAGRTQQPASDAPTSADVLARLRQSIGERDANLARQEQAWPTRQADQAVEAPTPMAVRELQAAQRGLESDIREALRSLESGAAADPGPLLDALAATESYPLADALAPLVARCAAADPRAFDSLAAAARRFRPPPLTVVRSLEALDSEPADLLLLQMGKSTLDTNQLRAAASSGNVNVIATLIRWAEGEDKPLARASLRALAKLEPPRARTVSPQALTTGSEPPRDAGEAAVQALMQMEAAANPRVDLTTLLMREILAGHSTELRVTLLGYLALFKDDSLGPFFDSLYRSESSEPLRVAAVSALGRLGERSWGILLAELAAVTNATSIRKACAHGLGAAKCKPAAPQLIACLEEPELEADALRALSSIAGSEIGRRSSDWTRWWRAQPECKAEDRDPELEGS